MTFLKPGDASRTLGTTCLGSVATTSKRPKTQNVPLDDGSCVVRDILAALCDRFGDVVAISVQSTPAIRAAMQSAQPKT